MLECCIADIGLSTASSHKKNLYQCPVPCDR